MKLARYWRLYKDQKVRCYLCRHGCLIYPDQAGLCQVRVNREGKLYSLVYAVAIAAHIDPIEKKPLYHYLPGARAFSIATVGCNFRCLNCQNHEISQYRYDGSEVVPGEYFPPEAVVRAAVDSRSEIIAYTYTEPTVFWEYVIDTAALAVKQGIKNILVTNGYMSDEALEDARGLIHAANVDFKSMRQEFYRTVVKARLDRFLEGLKKLYEVLEWIEVTTLIIPGMNDSEEELRDIARFIVKELSPSVPWHISRFFPHYKLYTLPPTPLSTIRRAVEIGYEEGLRFVYAGNVPGDKFESTYCPSCGMPLVKRFGYSIEEFVIENNRCPYCGEKIEGYWKKD